MTDLIDFLMAQVTNLGIAGLLIAAQWVAIIYLWQALREERARGEDLVNKMLEMSAEQSTMVERITGRRP